MPSDTRDTEEVTRHLHPISLLFTLGSAAWRLLLPGIIVLVASRGSNIEIWLMFLFVPAVIGAGVKYWSFRYRFGDGELVVRQGIVTRNERHIPYGRIQNIDLVQNPMHRLFGVAEVRLETAGGDTPEAVIRVLSLDAVDQMRARVFADDRPVTVGIEEGDSAADGPTRLLYHLPSREVLLFGIISNQGMVVVAAALGLLWQFDPFERWFGSLSTRTLDRFPRIERIDDPSTAVLFGLVALLGFVVLLRVFSVAWAFLKLHGFRLRRRGDDLRAEYGLLTRVSKTIPRQRIQVLSTRETLLHRWFGRVAVQVETAGSVGERDGSGEGRVWLAPLIHKERVGELVRQALPELEAEVASWQTISPRAFRRRFRLALLLLSLPAVAGLVGLGAWGLLVFLFVPPLAYLHARLYVKHTGYALTPGGVLYKGGWWVRRTSAARFSKIQALQLTRSPFDRRHGMASVQVDTAGAGRVGHTIDVDYLEDRVAGHLRDRLYEEAGRTAFRW